MLTVIGGLVVMLGSSPLAAQTAASAVRSVPSTVAPNETFTVTITASNYGTGGILTDALPTDFVFAGSDDGGELNDDGEVEFLLINLAGGEVTDTLTYTVTAPGTASSSPGVFRGTMAYRDDTGPQELIMDDSEVTVSDDDAVTPDPDPEVSPPLAIPDLDNLSASQASAIFAGTEGNSVSYTAASGADDAKVVARVSPGAGAIVTIDLGMAEITTDQQVNFSLTDGANLDFQIKKTGADTAMIVAKDGVDLTSGQYNFQLVVNEYGNAPANTEDVDVVVHVVIDNEAPMFTDAPASGTVAERAMDAAIATFSASDVNNQVLNYKIAAKAEDAGAASILRSLTIGVYSGALKTTEAAELPVDQPDYDEPSVDDPDTLDVDESERETDNEHVFIITVSDGTSSVEHEFTLTVTDVDDPAPGSNQKLDVDEDNQGGLDNSFGSAPALSGSGDFAIGEQIDNRGNITLDRDDILFDVDPASGAIYLKANKAGAIDFESGVTTYTVSVLRGTGTAGRSGIVVITVGDVNEAPTFSASDKARAMPIDLYVLESAAVGKEVSIGQDAGNNPTTIPARFTASDEDSAATGDAIAYDLWYDHDGDAATALIEYTGASATFGVSANGTISVTSMLDTDADDAVRSIHLVLRAVDAGEQGDPPDLTSYLKDVLMLSVTVIDTNVAPVFDDPSRAKTHASVSEGTAVGTEVHTYRATDEDGDTVRYRLRDQDDAPFFSVEETTNADGEEIGILRTAAGLDYETSTSHTVEIQAYDTDGDTDEIVVEIEITNENDERPVFDSTPNKRINVAENTPRGTLLANYSATDADGDTVTYSLDGANKKSFMIDAVTGDLMTLESLDYDSNTPCALAGCSVTVIATDGVHNALDGTSEPVVTIVVSPTEDSVSTLSVTKANPVPGTTMGDANTALGNTKISMSDDVPERPKDLPNANGAPLNFVETDWANWGTVLRIVVTAQSPDANCGSGNECVVISLNSDSADDTLKLQAYRMDTPAGAASNENKFVAAVMLVELDGHATDIKTSSGRRYSCVHARGRQRGAPAG